MTTASRLKTTDAIGYTEGLPAFMNGVLKYMGGGLAVTAIAAYIALQFMPVTEGAPTISNWVWVAFVAQMILVIAIGGTSMASRSGSGLATGLFVLYAALNGFTLAPLALVYTTGSLVTTFAVAACTFGGAAIYGSVTKRNLSSMGGLFGMLLWGLLAGLVINLFVGSPAMDYLLSAAGVVLFVGLTAWDMQKLEAMYNARAAQSSGGLAIYGALTLYLDFLNLFLFLLRFLGEKK